MKSLAHLRHLLFLQQELYAQLLNVSCSLIALIESNRRILRGTPLAIEGKFYTQWKALEEPETVEPPPSPDELAETDQYLEELEAKLLYKKRKLEEERTECLTLKRRARQAIRFYQNRDGSADNETEALVLGLGHRKARQEYARMRPTLLLELERRIAAVDGQLAWVREKKGG